LSVNVKTGGDSPPTSRGVCPVRAEVLSGP
jgi:hypothetical protein